MKRTLLIILSFLFLPIISHADTAFPTPNGDVHLIKSESPYILNSSVTIASGTTLTIDPGVCVKMYPIGYIFTQGNLIADGTESDPIIFTSIKNDSICGDSNGDGSASVPVAGDWPGLNISGDTALDNVEISYANLGILVNGGDFHIHSSNIHDNTDRGISISNAGGVEVLNTSFFNNMYPIDISIGIPFTHSGNTANGNQKNAIAINGTTVEDTHLVRDSIPYFVNNLSVASGTSVYIDPGVCVKMYPIGYIFTQGNLMLNGTKNEPVYITSVKDDSVCGDTNNDGSATVPNFGDWVRMEVKPGGSLTANYATVRFAGAQSTDSFHANIVNTGGAVILNNSTSTNALYAGFHQTLGTSTIISTGFGNQTTGVQIDGGDMNIHHSSFENNTGSAIDTSNITGASTTINATGNWWGNVDGPRHFPEKVSGTGQWINGDHIDFSGWLGGNPKSWNIDPVIIIPGILGSWKDWHGNWKLDPITHTYDNLVDTFKANGYTEGQNLFPFPYDWEKSNVDTAILLKQKIADVKAICNCTKVDIVAHSMGGLVARQYIQSNDYQNDVDQVIFIGTPHLGSVFAYLAYEGGGIGNTKEDQQIETAIKFIGLKRGFLTLQKYIHDMVLSMKELLPIDNYLQTSSTPINYPNGYPRNTFLESLDVNMNLVQQRVGSIRDFVGDLGTTSTKILLTISSTTDGNKWPDGEPIDIGYGNGDNRVSITSAERIGVGISIHNFGHSDLVTGVEKQVLEELLLNDVSNTINKSKSKNALILLVNSPIDITVTSPSGQIFGSNGTSNDSSGNFYTNIGDEEFLVINDPEQGQYQVLSTGTGQGEYSIDAHLISDSGDVVSSESGTTNIGQRNTSNFSVSNDSVQMVNQNTAITTNNLQLSTIAPTIQSTTLTVNEATSTTPGTEPIKPRARATIKIDVLKSPISTQVAAVQSSSWGNRLSAYISHKVKSLIKLLVGK